MKPVNKNQTFENFSVNDGNAWALAALKTVIRDKNYYNPVYIYGKEGVGKSHLLNATINAIVERNKVVFLSAKELVIEMVEKIMLSDDDYILIDDLQLLPKDKALEEKIAMLIEANKKQVIISSTIDPNSMEVSSTLQERLQWGLTPNMTSQNQWLVNLDRKEKPNMQEWIVVDQFGNVIAQGFYDKQSAEFYAETIPNASVEKKS